MARGWLCWGSPLCRDICGSGNALAATNVKPKFGSGGEGIIIDMFSFVFCELEPKKTGCGVAPQEQEKLVVWLQFLHGHHYSGPVMDSPCTFYIFSYSSGGHTILITPL